MSQGVASTRSPRDRGRAASAREGPAVPVNLVTSVRSALRTRDATGSAPALISGRGGLRAGRLDQTLDRRRLGMTERKPGVLEQERRRRQEHAERGEPDPARVAAREDADRLHADDTRQDYDPKEAPDE